MREDLIAIKLFILFFGVLFLSMFGGLNYYIGLRGWQNLVSTVPWINSRLYWVFYWCLAMSYLVSKFAGSVLPAKLEHLLGVAGAYWLAAMVYLLMIIVVVDLFRLADKKINFLPELLSGQRAQVTISVLMVVVLIGLMAFGTWSSRSIKITRYEVAVDKKCDDIAAIKVVMLSDLHLGNIVDRQRLVDIVHHINERKPDLVLIPGDIIDDVTEPFQKQKMGLVFQEIKSQYGVYASLGNHDGMMQSAEKTTKVLEESGIVVLRDKAIQIKDAFYLIGRDDNTVHRGSSEQRKTLSEILVGIDKSKPIIVMDHQPLKLNDAVEQGIDLQVSGHTHSGQLFPANLITSRIYEIDHGLIKKKNTNFVVSSGIGTWGPPIRIGSRAELVEIILNFK